MALVSLGTLESLRAMAESTMLDTVQISGPGLRVDLPGGGWRYEEGDVVTTKGSIGPLSKSAVERYQAERLEYAGLEQLEVPLSVPVSGQDRLAVTSLRHGGTRQYTVEGVTPLDTYAVSKVLIVKAVD